MSPAEDILDADETATSRFAACEDLRRGTALHYDSVAQHEDPVASVMASV